MHMTDYEQLKLFEEWLADDGPETTKKQKYPVISVLVKSGGKYRIFQTNAYTIRSLVVMLQRYNGNYRIVSMKYGEYGCPCPNWDAEYEPCEETDLFPSNSAYDEPGDLLRKYDYRTAINLLYARDSSYGKYPSKAPFKGVKCWRHGECTQFENRRYPFFIPCDEDNGDCLKYFDGRLISRYIDGEEIRGYYVTAPRIIEEKDDFNVEG